jgi:hypothetical protein
MTLNKALYRKLRTGMGHEAALVLADPAQDSVSAATVAAPTAITSVVAAGANPTKAEYDALRVDVTNLRTTVANLLTSLKNAGIVL